MSKTDSSNWARAERLYHAALERPEGQRAEFLETACEGDEAMRREVESLLRYDGPAEGLEEPAVEKEARRLAREADDSETRRPSLTPGTRVGDYEVLSPLGAGGMGEVYRARDTRLGREVAIKVLPREALSDEGRRARFVREARAASALNHPHIVTIHEIESEGDLDFIVMELVVGTTLAQRMRRGPLSLDEALRIAIPLADALRAAHGAGVVHRDLKPANVMVAPEGGVKVLDFGLAKRVGHVDSGATADGGSAASLSRTGEVMGTAGYLSPEQARGGDVDARTDIFSFGAVLYEMLTGHRAFKGSSSADIVAAVLKEQPKAPSELAPGVPKELERIVLRCLSKEPERRFQHAADLKVELQEVKEESDAQALAQTGAATARRRRWRRWGGGVALTVAILATALTAPRWGPWRSAPPPPTVVQLTSARQAHAGSFSPDGDELVFASAGEKGDNWDIWLRIVGAAETRRLTTDPAVDDDPSWSPDGKQIAFLRFAELHGSRAITTWDAGGLHLVSPLGGSERRVSDLPVRGRPSWSPDGRWLAAAKAPRGADPPGGIHLIPVGPGERCALTSPHPPAFDMAPAFSPDGAALAYAACEGADWSFVCDVHVLPLDPELNPAGAARRLTRQHLYIQKVAWTRDGRSIVYGASGSLWRVRADGSAPPERVELAGRGAGGPFTTTGRDRLGFVRQPWDPDVYRLRLGSSPTPLIESAFADDAAGYSPDGRRIAFCSDRADDRLDVWLADADGSNQVRLTNGPGHRQCGVWSPDGRSVTFESQGDDGRLDIWRINVDGSALRQVTSHPADEFTPSWSRDGRTLYFTSNRTGRNEVWRVPRGGGSEEQVTDEGGCGPFESPDGRTLYFRRACSRSQPILARPTAGGEERTVLPCASRLAPDPRGGILYLECPREGAVPSRHQLRRFDEATGEDQPVATIEGDFISGFSVSADGQTILYGLSSWGTSDLLMIENFR